MPRLVVVDTSVQLSGLVLSKHPTSPGREILARGFARHFDFAVSEALIAEIARKLVEKGVDLRLVVDHIERLRFVGVAFEDVDPSGFECDDPDDLFIVALASTAAAWCVVSHDAALIRAERVPPGWSVGEFLGHLREERGEAPKTTFP